jgi:hypothetical protein
MGRTDFQQDCIIVLGMHRSGTSAMARVVNILGAEIGDDLISAEPDNPKGYWEHREVLHLHDRALKNMGSIWDDVTPLPSEWWDEAKSDIIRSELIEAMRRSFGGSKLWVLKEPRMCRLLKLWHPIFTELNCKAHFIIVFRNPMEVASSLGKRNGLPVNKSLLLWLCHILESEEDTRGYPRVFVSFEELLGDWKTTMERLSAQLQIAWPVSYSDAQCEIEEFLDPGLVHHHCADNPLARDLDLSQYVSLVHRELIAAQNSEADTIAEAFTTVSENLHKELQHFITTALVEEAQFRLAQMDRLRERLRHSHKQLYKCTLQLEDILNSKSWKLTEPLRKIGSFCLRRKMPPKKEKAD